MKTIMTIRDRKCQIKLSINSHQGAMPDANSSLLLPPMALAISSIRHRQSTPTITITIARQTEARWSSPPTPSMGAFVAHNEIIYKMKTTAAEGAAANR